jgi:translocation and assembly module TamB
VTLNKRLSANASMALEQNLVGTESVVKLTYKLTRYLSVIVRGGTDNAVDMQYEISFK